MIAKRLLKCAVRKAQDLGIELRRVGKGQRKTFGEGERALNDWLEPNARVAWLACHEPWWIEERLIRSAPAELGPKSAPPFSLGTFAESACGESASKGAGDRLTEPSLPSREGVV